MSTAAIQRQEASIIETLVSQEWPRSIIEVVRQQVAPKGIPEADFYVFMRKCQQSGLNPLTGEAHCIPRNTKGPDGKHATIYTFQPSAEGMRARAGKFPDFLGCDGGAVYESDLVTMDQGTGEVSHKSNPAKARGRLMGAWGRVTKADGSRFLVWLPVGSRSGNSSFWTQDPGSMLRKCAIVAALREAYPVAFGGIYAREEMEDERQTTRAEVVLGTVEPVKEEPAALSPPPALDPVVEFGEWKGRVISELSAEEKAAAIKYADWQVQQHPKMSAKVKGALEKNVAAIRESMAPAEEVLASTLPITHPDAEPPSDVVLPGQRQPGEEG